MFATHRNYLISLSLLGLALASCASTSPILRANPSAPETALNLDARNRPTAVGAQQVTMTDGSQSSSGTTSAMISTREEVWKAWTMAIADGLGQVDASCSGAAFNEVRHHDRGEERPTSEFAQPTAAVCHSGPGEASQAPLLAWIDLALGCDDDPIGQVRTDGQVVTLRCAGPLDGETELVRDVALQLDGLTLAWLHLGNAPALAVQPGLPLRMRRALERAAAVALSLNAVLPPARNGDQVRSWASPEVARFQLAIRQAGARPGQ